MSNSKISSKKASVRKDECVACGSCALQCQSSAIHITNGQFAVIDTERCIGCGSCALICPASVIYI